MLNTNKKSVAILCSGRTECYEQVYDRNISNVLEPLKNAGYEVNLFGSFWDEDNSEKFIQAYESDFKTFEVETLTKYTGGVIKNFNEYNHLITVYDVGYQSALTNTMYWLYKLNRTYGLVKQYESINNMSYDYYIRIRPDITLSSKLDVDLMERLTDNSIILHVDHVVNINGSIQGYREGWIDDNFCIAKKQPFDMYCGIYDNLVELIHKYESGVIHVIYQHLFKDKNIQTIIPNSPLLMVKNKEGIINKYLLFLHSYPELDVDKYVKEFF